MTPSSEKPDQVMPRIEGPPAWIQRLGLACLVVSLTACATSHSPQAGHLNQPLSKESEAEDLWGSYLASMRVPWCVNLAHPDISLAKARKLRQSYYLTYNQPVPEPGRGVVTAPARGVESVEAVRRAKSSCWSLVRQTEAGVGPDQHSRQFLGIALPGGGSRSAVFSAAALFELERRGVLEEVDVFSAVSGGALPAAMYVRSCTTKAECAALYADEATFLWTQASEQRVLSLLGTEFFSKDPFHVSLRWNQWLSGGQGDNRTDALAQAFATKLFPSPEQVSAHGMRFGDLNPRRPNLLVNAMDSTGKELGPGLKGHHFLFTLEVFEHNLHSDLGQYPLAYAVAGSNALPGVFDPLPLAGYPAPTGHRELPQRPSRYLHIVDGGLYDRLGGEAIRSVLEDIAGRERPCDSRADKVGDRSGQDCIDRAIAVVLDSGLPVKGEDASRPSVVATGGSLFLDPKVKKVKMASFALLDLQAEMRLDSLKAFVQEQNKRFRERYGVIRNVFQVMTIRLRDVQACITNPVPCAEVEGSADRPVDELAARYRDLWSTVRAVPLSLSMRDEDAVALQRAARILVRLTLASDCRDRGHDSACAIYAKGESPQFSDLSTGGPTR